MPNGTRAEGDGARRARRHGVANRHPWREIPLGADERTQDSYYFLNTSLDEPTPEGRWTSGPSLDGRSEFSVEEKMKPYGQKPDLGRARPGSGAQTEQE